MKTREMQTLGVRMPPELRELVKKSAGRHRWSMNVWFQEAAKEKLEREGVKISRA